MRDIKDEIVMITGASSGFGMETAKLLVKEHGAKVVLGARRADRLNDLVKELGEDRAFAQACDVTKRSDLEALAQAGIAQFGRIDALVNNAGIMPLSPLAAGRVDEWDNMIDTNIKGVLYAIHAVLGHMLERGSGNIVNVSSVAGLLVSPAVAVYSATKFAVRAISEGLRAETAGKLQICCVYPGAFQTELAGSVKDEATLAVMRKRFTPDLVQPAKHIAETIIFALCQERNVAVNEIVMRPVAQPM